MGNHPLVGCDFPQVTVSLLAAISMHVLLNRVCSGRWKQSSFTAAEEPSSCCTANMAKSVPHCYHCLHSAWATGMRGSFLSNSVCATSSPNIPRVPHPTHAAHTARLSRARSFFQCGSSGERERESPPASSCRSLVGLVGRDFWKAGKGGADVHLAPQPDSILIGTGSLLALHHSGRLLGDAGGSGPAVGRGGGQRGCQRVGQRGRRLPVAVEQPAKGTMHGTCMKQPGLAHWQPGDGMPRPPKVLSGRLAKSPCWPHTLAHPSWRGVPFSRGLAPLRCHS
jgi:hypothetical protein